MQHTTNYNLSQWDAEDRVTRAAFNADNAKIDAALKANADAIANAGGLTTIKTVTITSSSRNYTLDLSEVGLAQWKAIYIEMAIIGSGTWYPAFSADGAQEHLVGAQTGVTNYYRLALLPLYNGEAYVSGQLFGANTQILFNGNTGTKFKDVTAFYLLSASGSNFYIQPGSWFTVYGEK